MLCVHQSVEERRQGGFFLNHLRIPPFFRFSSLSSSLSLLLGLPSCKRHDNWKVEGLAMTFVIIPLSFNRSLDLGFKHLSPPTKRDYFCSARLSRIFRGDVLPVFLYVPGDSDGKKALGAS